MIKIKNLRKWYKSKNGRKHQALKNISLEMGNKGLVVLLGKSGSGKSTLLNILGGLDKFDSGEITINGNSTLNFKNDQWDSYRNSYIGFVFQSFNIMENISVSDNVALPLELQGYNREDITRLVDEVLERVDLKEYKDRKSNELSGGQKQRVAIARALVKDPEIILADEPTGNLDSKTGKSILEILKKLSKDKLVIMVTHDERFAYEYGDRIIELKDGEIINDNFINDYIDNNDNNEEFKFKKLSLSFKNAFEIAKNSIFLKKVRLTIMMILFIISLVSLGITTNFANYNSNKAAYYTFKKEGINQLLMEKRSNPHIYIVGDGDSLTIRNRNDDYLNSLKERFKSIESTEFIGPVHMDVENIDFNKYKYASPYYAGFTTLKKIPNMVIFEDINQFSKYDYEIIVGDGIKDNNDLLITDYIAEILIDVEMFGNITIEELIGKELSFDGYKFDISGIVDTDQDKWKELTMWDWEQELTDEFNFKLKTVYTTIFTTQEAFKMMLGNISVLEDDSIHIRSQQDGVFKNVFSNITSIRLSTFDNHYGTLIGDSQLPVNTNDVVISLSWVLKALNESSDYKIEYEDIINDPDQFITNIIGSYVDIDGYRLGNDEYKIVGIFDDVNNDTKNILIFNDETFEQIIINNFNLKKVRVLFSDNDKENINLLNDLDSNGYRHLTKYSDLIYEIDTVTKSTKDMFLGLSVVFAVFTSVMIYTFISSSINAHKKEIGILRSLGARGMDVAKIFVVESITIAVIAATIAIISMTLIIRLINNQIVSSFNTNLVLLYNDFLSIVLVLVVAIIIALISSLVPIIRIVIMKPIDAIKNK